MGATPHDDDEALRQYLNRHPAVRVLWALAGFVMFIGGALAANAMWGLNDYTVMMGFLLSLFGFASMVGALMSR